MRPPSFKTHGGPPPFIPRQTEGLHIFISKGGPSYHILNIGLETYGGASPFISKEVLPPLFPRRCSPLHWRPAKVRLSCLTDHTADLKGIDCIFRKRIIHRPCGRHCRRGMEGFRSTGNIGLETYGGAPPFISLQMGGLPICISKGGPSYHIVNFGLETHGGPPAFISLQTECLYII